MVRVVVDAMGGDHAPREVTRGAVAAACQSPELNILLVGHEDRVRAELPENTPTDRVQIVHAEHVVEMHESPVSALKSKPDTSIGKCVGIVSAGEADALVSAGNTGGVVAATTLGLKRLPNARRAGIAVPLPARGGPCVLMDVGANINCKPRHLVQYAVMANEYAMRVLGVEQPRVAILSVGDEESKGNPLVKRVGATLRAYDGVQFVGNVEGQQIFAGDADVVICEGFVGNVILKAAEGLSEVFYRYMLTELNSHMGKEDERVGLILSDFQRDTDYAHYGGAPLMGHAGSVFICHGRSHARAMENAVLRAAEFVAHGVQGGIAAALDRLASSDAMTELAKG